MTISGIDTSLGYFRRSPRNLIGIYTLVFASVFILGYFSRSVSADITRAFLSTIAIIQGSVLAIVFSVTILGVQQVSNRYSPRLIELFVKAPIFYFVFGAFLLSIGFDLFLLYNISQPINSTGVGFVYAAGALGVMNGVSLYLFISTMLERSTPDGLISAYEYSISPDKYFERATESTEPDTAFAHPLYPLYGMTMSAISSQEWLTAKRAIHSMGKLGTETIVDVSGTNRIPLQGFPPESRALFEEPHEEYFPEITIHAFEREDLDLVQSSIEAQADIGLKGIDVSRHYFTSQAMRGLSDTFRETPPTMKGNQVRGPVLGKMSDLLKQTARKPDLRVLWSLFGAIDQSINWLFRQDAEQWAFGHPIRRYFDQDLVEVQKILLKNYGRYLETVDFNWRQSHPPDDLRNRRLFAALFRWRQSFFGLSIQMVRYRERNDKYPINRGNINRAWAEACKNAAGRTSKDYTAALVELMIQVAYQQYLVSDRFPRQWAHFVSEIEADYPEVVAQAIYNLENEGHGWHGSHLRETRLIQKSDRRGIFGTYDMVTGKNLDFDEWIGEFVEEVHDD